MEQRAIKLCDWLWMCEPQIASSWRTKRKIGRTLSTPGWNKPLYPVGCVRS